MSAKSHQHVPAVTTTRPPARTVREAYDRALSATDGRSRFVELPSGRRLHVVEAGDGPTLVHLHGTSTCGLSHVPLLARMPQVRSVLIDRPGAGLTEGRPVPAKGYREGVVALMDELLDTVSDGPVALAGASMGGTWALWYALARPGRVQRLALLGAAPLLPGTEAPVGVRLSVVPWIDALTRRLVPASRSTVARFMRLMGEEDTICDHLDVLDGLVAGRRDPIQAKATRDEFRVGISLFARAGMKPSMRITAHELRRLTMPTLLVWGDQDPIGSVDAAREIARTIPDARLEVLHAGHVPWLGHPDRVAELLDTFLSGE